MPEYFRKRWKAAGAFVRDIACLALVLALAGVMLAPADESDADGDGMSDSYELFYNLNPTNAADASADYDLDGLTNLEESERWTDPFVSDTDRDLWIDSWDSGAVSRAYLDFGNTQYTSSNSYEYAAPDWWVSTLKNGGIWQTNPSAWYVPGSMSAGVGRLYIDVDRSLLTNDVVLELGLFDHTNSSLYLDLYNSNDVLVASNVFGNLLTGAAADMLVVLDVPFGEYSNAVGIQLRRGVGEVSVYDALIYVDWDGDGLDAEQEAQLQTSDLQVDSDGDGMSDPWEANHGFDPVVDEGYGVPEAGIRMWVKANSLGLGDSSPVLSWPDVSGQGNGLTQVATNMAPVFETNSVNGEPAVVFDGSDDYLGGNLGNLASPMTIVTVGSFAYLNQPGDNDNDYVIRIGDGQTAYGHVSISRRADYQDDDDRYYTWLGTDSPMPLGPVLPGQSWKVMIAVHGTNAPRHALYIDGAAATVGQYDQDLDLNGAVELGRYAAGGQVAHHLNGKIAEVIVYDRALAAAERREIEDYLQRKYGINRAPEVDAGPDLSAVGDEVVTLDATVIDDGLPDPPGTTTTLWTKVLGPGSVSFGNEAAVDTTAQFSESGAYRLRLTAWDGEAQVSDDVDVLVALPASTNVPTAGLRLWAKANAIVANDGNAVTFWQDSSAAANDLVQGVGDEAPILRTDAVNGQPAVGFDGSDDWLSASLGSLDAPLTMIVVGRFAQTNQPTGDYDYFLRIGDPSVNHAFVSMSRWAAGADGDRYYSWLGPEAQAAFGPLLVGGAWHALIAVHDTNAPRHGLTLDEEDVTVDDYAAPLQLNGELELGRFSGTAHHLDGEIAEVLVYDRVLTGGERADLSSYLKAKYAVNRAPVVDAGSDLSGIQGQALSLDGSVVDDGLPVIPGTVTTLWSRVIGPDTVIFDDAASVDTAVTFVQPGGYVLRLTASDGEKERYDDVAVLVVSPGSTNVPGDGLRLWVAASDLALDDDMGVETWADRSGSSNDLAQVTAAQRPVFRTNTVNGHAALEFDGSDDWLSGSLGSIDAPLTMIVVGRFAQTNQPTGDYDYLLRLGDHGSAYAFASMSRWAAGADGDRYYSWMGAGGGAAMGPVLTGGVWQIMTSAHDTNSPRHSFYVNSSAQTVDGYSQSVQLNGELEVGRFSSSHHHLDGEIAEVIIYDRILSSEERGAVESYLYAKYFLAGDSDGDGLSDADEISVYRTDPFDVDTDEDGMSDGVEVANGADPAAHNLHGKLPFTEGFENKVETIVLPGQGIGPRLGWDVAVDGDHALASASWQHFLGATYTYERTNLQWQTNWRQRLLDNVSSDQHYVYFGEDLELIGDRALISADGEHNENGNDGGAVYVYDYTLGKWEFTVKLLAAKPAIKWFGSSVCFDGSRAAILGYDTDVVDMDRATMFVYRIEGKTYELEQALMASDGLEGHDFGRDSVLLDDVLFVGAYTDDNTNGVDAGCVYVFEREGTNWTETQKLIATDGAAGDYFGAGMAANEDTLVVGARKRDSGATDSGAAYVFHFENGSWVEKCKVLPPDPSVDAQFGTALALNGKVLVVGSPEEDVAGNNRRGAVYVFHESNPTNWTPVQRILGRGTDANDTFGKNIDASDDCVIVGAIGYSALSGAAFIYPSITRKPVSEGVLHGQNNWEVAPTTNAAVVQGDEFYGGAASLKFLTSAPAVTASCLIGAVGEPTIWEEFYTMPGRWPTGEHPPVSSNVAAAFYVNADGHMVVCDGTNGWLALPHVSIPTGSWARITTLQDFTNQEWSMWVDGAPVIRGVGFANDIGEYSVLSLAGAPAATSYVDSIAVQTCAPTNLDLVTVPAKVSGSVSYDGLGLLTGTVRIAVATTSNGWDSIYCDTLEGTGAYSVAGVPTPSNYWVLAYIDADGDGLRDPWEPHGEYPGNPLTVTNDVAGVDVLMHDSALDSDSDNLPDWWEEYWFGTTTNQTGTNDCDSDNLINTAEYYYGTCPTNADTDSDGWSDGLETGTGTDPKDDRSYPVSLSGSISYTGPQTGHIRVIAVPVADSWSTNYSIYLTGPGVYSVSNIPNQESYWFKAWRDSNSNGLSEAWEATGSWTSNPTYLTNDITGVNITLTDPNLDSDAYSDWWEVKHFGTLEFPVDTDVDGDGLTSAEEYVIGTDPNSIDTDGDGVSDGQDSTPVEAGDSDSDGLPDDWETHWFGDLDEIASDDPDGDGITNLQEYKAGTDPMTHNEGDSGNSTGLTVFRPTH